MGFSTGDVVHAAKEHLRRLGNTKVLLGMGVLAEGFYLSLTLLFPLPRLYASIPPWDVAKLTGYGLVAVFALLGGYVVLFTGLAWLMWHTGDTPSGEQSVRLRRVVFAGAGVFALTLLFLYPIYAIDLFLYLVHTRIWLVHGANPLLVPASRFPQDVWVGLVGEWVTATSGYSPLWEMVAAIPGMLAGPHRVLWHALGLKGIAVLAYLADVWLLDRILARVWPNAWARVWRLLFFAWNPLVLLELVGNGHNDGLMLTFLLLSLLLTLQGRELGGHAALGLSVLIKVTPLFLWPLLWLWGLSRRNTWNGRWRYSLGVATIVMLTGLAFVPFLWPNPRAWQALRESESAGWSLQALFILMMMALRVPDAYTRVQMVMQGTFLFLYTGLLVWAVRMFWRQRARSLSEALPSLVHVWLTVLLAVVVLFASNWRPWYATWFVALAALAAHAAWYRGVYWLSFTAASGHLFWSDVRWRFRHVLSPLLAHIIGVLWVFGVPAGVGVHLWRSSRQDAEGKTRRPL